MVVLRGALIGLIFICFSEIQEASGQINFEPVMDFEGKNHQFGTDFFQGGGGGISFADFNDDGLPDLTYGTGMGQNPLFLVNNEGVFEEIDLGIINTDVHKQVIWADYDNDGDKDLFLAVAGGINRVYRNEGNGYFPDATFLLGLPTTPQITSGISLGDIDNDGFLDMYLSRYSIDENVTNQLFRFNGAYFEDITAISGTGDGNQPSFCSSIADFNGDGLMDIHVANDHNPFANSLFINNGSEFVNQTENFGTNLMVDAMNSGAYDFDQDGDLDLYITNNSQGNYLLRNNNDGTFSDKTDNHNLRHNIFSWGAGFFDADNDTDLDLLVCNAPVSGQGDSSMIYSNDNLWFSPVDFLGDTSAYYAFAYADYDLDGDLDIAVSSQEDPFMLYENVSPGTGNYLCIDIEGTEQAKDAPGTWIFVHANNRTYTRYTQLGESFLAQHSPTVHFGLANNETVDSLEVVWLDGSKETIYDIPANQCLEIIEGEGWVNAPQDTTVTDTTVEDSVITFTPTLLNNDLDISAYPNPGNLGADILLVSSPPVSSPFDVIIFNAFGRLVYREQIEFTGGKSSISPTFLPKGVYLIKMIDAKGNSGTLKYMVQ